MGLHPNGRAVEHNKTRPKGTISSPSTQQQLKPEPSSTKTISIFARLLFWYTIFVALFQCPSSPAELSDQSSPICKPYLTLRSYASPYISPYYDQYVSPYTDAARPYVGRLGTEVLTPAVELGKKGYTEYLAPRVDQARLYSHDHWEQKVKPHIRNAQAQVNAQYSAAIAPHVDRVSSAAAPYYSAGKTNVVQAYNDRVLPAYTASRPYAAKAYGVVNKAVFETGYPYAKWACLTSIEFLNRTLWPQMRILYGENVEPQLLRISERLGRYRDSQKLKAAIDEVDNTESFEISSSEIIEPVDATPGISQPHSVGEANPSQSFPNDLKKDAEDREKISKDLLTWQEKFLKAADKGAEDLRERVQDITNRQVESQVNGVGKALIIQLEQATASETTNLKGSINNIVQSLPADPSKEDFEKAEGQVSEAVRNAAVAIKFKAQSLRSWKQGFDKETQSLVNAASVSTLDVLDNIRDLGLQEIGMRWAWMDGVTYKDWAEYHKLKKAFDEWRNEVGAVATSHEGLQKSTSAAEELESKGISIAEDAAKELSRLKEVALWKVYAQDASDNFSTRNTPAKVVLASKLAERSASAFREAAAKSANDAASAVGENVVQATEGAANAVSSASSVIVGAEPGVVEKASTGVSQAVIGTQQALHESILSAGSEKATKIVGEVSEALIDLPDINTEGLASSAASAVSIASEGVIGTSEAPLQSFTPTAKSLLDDVVQEAGNVILGAPPPESDNMLSKAFGVASEASSSAESIATAASSNIFAGAMAQDVAQQIPIFEEELKDDNSYSGQLHGFAENASDKLADLTKAMNEAIARQASAQDAVESVTSLAGEKYSSALAAASQALYGPEPGAAEKLSRVASDRYSDAVSAASSVLYGTPLPVHESVISQAKAQYAEATKTVREQYDHALSIASIRISETPDPAHQKLLSSFESAYSDSMAAASKRLDSALTSASSAVWGSPPSMQQSMIAAANAKYSAARDVALAQLNAAKTAVGATSTPIHESLISEASARYSSLISMASSQHAFATDALNSYVAGPTQGALESISAVASSRLSEGIRAASAQYESARTALGATPTATHEQYLIEAKRRYYEGIGLAHDRYSEFVTAASQAVYGAPTPVYQSLYNQASEAILGTPGPAYHGLLDTAQSQYSDAAKQASQVFQAALVSASSVAGITSKSPAQSILDSVSSQYSAALSIASVTLESASHAASTAFYGTYTGPVESIASKVSKSGACIVPSETPWSESAASQISAAASQNWDALVSRASEQVYGQPTPFAESIYSQASAFAAQATDSAAAQFSAVQILISELVAGKEPDFTESVMNRLSSAYYTGAVQMASSASTYANEAYASASSIVSSVFTPPATLEAIIDSASEQVNSAMEAASLQLYGSSKGSWAEATSTAAASYQSAQSKISEAVYGTQPSYIEAAQSSIQNAAASAQSAISEAIYGTSQGTTGSVASAAAEAYDSATLAASENLSAASSHVSASASSLGAKVSSAIYGEQQSAVESASARLSDLVENARDKLAEMAEQASGGAADNIKAAQFGMEEMASSVSSMVGSATARVKDEL